MTVGVSSNTKFAAVSADADDALDRDRLAVGERDHRIAGGIVGEMRLHIGEACQAGVADQVDLVRGGVEVVHHVVADRLREDERSSAPAEPVSVSSPDQAKIGEPGA